MTDNQQPVDQPPPAPAAQVPAEILRFWELTQQHPDMWDVLGEVDRQAREQGWDTVRDRIRQPATVPEPDPDPAGWVDPDDRITRLEARLAESEAARYARDRDEIISQAWDRFRTDIDEPQQQAILDLVARRPGLLEVDDDAPVRRKMEAVQEAFELARRAVAYDTLSQQAREQARNEYADEMDTRRKAAAASGTRTAAPPATGPRTDADRNKDLLDNIRRLRKGESLTG